MPTKPSHLDILSDAKQPQPSAGQPGSCVADLTLRLPKLTNRERYRLIAADPKGFVCEAVTTQGDSNAMLAHLDDWWHGDAVCEFVRADGDGIRLCERCAELAKFNNMTDGHWRVLDEEGAA